MLFPTWNSIHNSCVFFTVCLSYSDLKTYSWTCAFAQDGITDSIYSLGCNHITNKNPRKNIWSFKHWTTGSTGHWSPKSRNRWTLPGGFPGCRVRKGNRQSLAVSVGCGGPGGYWSLETRELHKARLQRAAGGPLKSSDEYC